MVAGVGTAGNIWIVLNALLNINIKDKIYVDMTVEKTINTENLVKPVENDGFQDILRRS